MARAEAPGAAGTDVLSVELRVWTVGHSTRTAAGFRSLLTRHGIELVADVRRFPASRRYPHFGSDALAQDLAGAGICYTHLAALGGRRRQAPGSDGTGWTHPAFRAYAGHVMTGEFADGLLELLVLAGGLRTAVMCAELLWWRCHRRLVADVLVSLGAEVLHIRDGGVPDAHRLAPPARIVGGALTYTATGRGLR